MEKVRAAVASHVGADRDAFRNGDDVDFMAAGKAMAQWSLENARDEVQRTGLALAAALANFAWALEPEEMQRHAKFGPR